MPSGQFSGFFILSRVAAAITHADSDHSCRLRREPYTPCAVALRALPPRRQQPLLCSLRLELSLARTRHVRRRLCVVASPTERCFLFPFRRPGACEPRLPDRD